MDRSDVETVRARTDIVELIAAYTALKPSGNGRFKGLCPFHQEKTPSFVVDREGQRWHCFGACGTGGDCFKFLERAENLSFPEALQKLALQAGITLAPRGQTPAEREASARAATERDRVFAANAAALRFFRERFRRSTDAQSYARGRGLIAETLENFQIGWAPDEWTALSEFLIRREKVHPDDAVAAGLIMASRRGDGTFTDRFRGRLVFPILDVQERVVGFGGRIIEPKPDAPKYLNSPETPVFSKGRVLYGMNRARKAIAGAKGSGREGGDARLLVVEGYMDVVAAHQAGIENVVATLGTAMTEEHVRLIRRYGVADVVLSFDADEAGGKAALRAADLLAAVGEGLSLRVLGLPPGEDPDSLLRKGGLEGAAKFRRAIDAALSVPEFQIRSLQSRFDVKQPAGRAGFLHEAIQVIATVPSLMEQQRLVQRVARFHPTYETNGRKAEEHIADEVSKVGGRRGTAVDDGFGGALANGGGNGNGGGYPRRGGPGQAPYRRDFAGGGPGGNGGGGRRSNGGGNGYPQRPFVAPDPVPMPVVTHSAADEAERTVLRALLSDEWSPVLLRLLSGAEPPPLGDPWAVRLMAELWPLVSGSIAPSRAIRELADADLADRAAALAMEGGGQPLSEPTIEDALRRVDQYRYQREMEQIRSRLTPEGGGNGVPDDELLRQWSARARTLKRGGPGSDGADGGDG